MAKLEEVSQVNLQLDTEDVIELLGNIELELYSEGYSNEHPEITGRELRASIKELKETLTHYYNNEWGVYLTASSTVSISETTL